MKLLSLPTSPKLVLRSQLRSAGREPLPPITPIDPKIDRHELPDSKVTADFEAAQLPDAYVMKPASYSDDEFDALAPQIRQCKTYAIDAAYLTTFQLRYSLPDAFAALQAPSLEETILRPAWRVFVVDRTAFVVFCGTATMWEWPRNFVCLPGLHLGFLISYLRHAPVILSTLEKLDGSGFDRIIVTGHSAGGAIAQLMTRELLRCQLPVAACITFAGPRVFGIFSTAHWNSEFKKISHRIVNQHDLVLRFPPMWYAFLHIGRRINRVVEGSNPMRRFWGRVYDMCSDAFNVFDNPVESSGSFATENEMTHLDRLAKEPLPLSSDPASADTMHGHQPKPGPLTTLSNKEVKAKQYKTAMQTREISFGLAIDWDKPFDEQSASRQLDLTQSDRKIVRPHEKDNELEKIMRVFGLKQLGLMFDKVFQGKEDRSKWETLIHYGIYAPFVILEGILQHPLWTLVMGTALATMYMYITAGWVIVSSSIAAVVVIIAGLIALLKAIYSAHMLRSDDRRPRDYM